MMGRLIIMGSGETAPPLVATHRGGIEAAGAAAVTVVDSPFGFQENVEQLSAKLTDFFRTSLQVDAVVASLRSPAASTLTREQTLAAIRRARYVFAGPGSPSYALRVWEHVPLAEALFHVITAGGTVTFASAAALTLGSRTIPVYEIYKVGEDPHWLDGLDLTGRLGLRAIVVPHWNNAEGGNHDTSRCYIGARRFDQMRSDLDVGVIGVDEHSAAVIDFATGTISAHGVGGVVILGESELRLESGEQHPLEAVQRILAPARPAPDPSPQPQPPATSLADAVTVRSADAAAVAVLEAEERAAQDPELRPVLRALIVDLADAARDGFADPEDRVRPFVEALLRLRDQARGQRDYATSDEIRDDLSAAGVEVRDTPDGVTWSLRS